MVLVHANPFDNTLWTYQVAHFSTWFKVISVDIRGYGRSVKQQTPFTLKDMCDDVVGVMRDAGVESAILMGCSVGSSIALLLGLDHPELFDAVILVGGNSEPSDRFQHRIDGYTKELSTYHLQHMHLLVERKFSESRLGAYLLNRYVERQPRLDGEAIAQVFRAANSVRTTGRLHEMKPPVLVINGETDYSRPGGERTAKLIPKARLVVIEDSGHFTPVEQPEALTAILRDMMAMG
jgi:pimeloyl-ACP methyl ester carboxylesterase